MTLQTFWLYVGAVALIACTPGPNVLYVTTRSIRFGFGAALAGIAGCLLALTTLLIGSVAGVSTFMMTVPAAFTALKYVGAAYLIVLGIQTWRAPLVLPVADPGRMPRGAEPLRADARRLSLRHQQPKAAHLRRCLLSAVHRAGRAMGAAIRLAGRHVPGRRDPLLRCLRTDPAAGSPAT